MEETTEENQKRDEKFGKVVVIDAFKKDINHKYDEMENKISELERTLNQAVFALKSSQIKPDYEATLNLPEFGNSIKEAQEKNIKLSRRLQFLSLQQQQANNFIIQKTFAQPKNELNDFISEFDDSLKNTTLLAQRITALNKKYESVLNPLQDMDSEVEKLYKETSKWKSTVLANRRIVNKTTESITKLIQENDVLFDQKLKDLQNQIEDEMESSNSKTEDTLENVDNNQEEEEENMNRMKNDLNKLLINIQTDLNKRIQNIQSSIDLTTKKCIEDIQQLESDLEEEMNHIYDQRIPTQTIDDEFEYFELDAIISRFEDLKSKYNTIKEYDLGNDSATVKQEDDDNITENEENKNTNDQVNNNRGFKVYIGEKDGVSKSIRCYDDGTFEEIDDIV